jgi:hypothetical protein
MPGIRLPAFGRFFCVCYLGEEKIIFAWLNYRCRSNTTFVAANLINKVQVRFPRGAPFGSEALHALGVSNDLVNHYVRSGWLTRLGRGVFMHAGDDLQLDASLVFLESRMKDLHVAAKSALARHGYRQNLAVDERLILWSASATDLPGWFTGRFSVRMNRSRIFLSPSGMSSGLVRPPESPEGPGLAEPELALLEMLSEVGVHQEVEEARAILESMRQIRIRRLRFWLGNCKQVKTVRLCICWAHELDLPWAEGVRSAVSPELLQHRWVSRLPDGSTLSLPAFNQVGVS